MKLLITGLLVMAAMAVATAASACGDVKGVAKTPDASKSTDAPKSSNAPVSVKPINERKAKDEKTFEARKLTEEDMERISGKSYKPGEALPQDELRLLTLTYYGYDNKTHYGEMIVNMAVSAEILEIFQELYDAKFPIEKIKLIDAYDADDDRSMADNNTSAYNHRFISGTRTLSNHAKGLAIDINPLHNPYVKGSFISPEEGAAYTDRAKKVKGMIIKDDVCYEAFTKRGWEWGGDWKSPKDYQHFEKIIKN